MTQLQQQSKKSNGSSNPFLQPISIREIILIGFSLFMAFLHYNESNDISKHEKDKIVLEERIKHYQKDAIIQAAISDSLETNAKVLEGVIEYQKHNPKIIEKKYVEVRNDVLNLSDDDKIKYLAARLSKKNSH